MGFITIQEAAKRSGLNEGHIRRMAETLAERGQAQRTMQGGKLFWQINEASDSRFLKNKPPELLPFDLRSLREKDREKTLRRQAILESWKSWCRDKLSKGFTRTQALNSFLSAFPEYGISRANLYRWEKNFDTKGVKGLVDNYIQRERSISPEAAQYFKQHYLTQNKLSIAICYKVTCSFANDNNLTWFNTLRACQLWVNTFIRPEVVLKREGSEAYQALCAPYIQRDPEQYAPNECWVGDHHQLDLWCNDRGRLIRPWLTAWLDPRSRVLVGWSINPSPNQSTILLAFRMGCKGEFGPPRHIYIDNGKDYDSFLFHGRTKLQRKRELDRGYINEGVVKGLFGQMGITCTFATPYNPQAKGWIERFFGTVEGQFGKTFQTYCGNKPENRPESTDKILADVKKGNDPAGIPSIDHVRHEFGRWVEEVYHVTPHTGAGMDNTPPIAFMRENLDSKRVAEEHVLDLMLMSWSKPVKVGKHGVVFNRINYGMQSVELFAVQGQEVRVAYDPNDVSEVAVFDLQGRYLCKAKASGIVTGMTDEDIRQGIAYKRHITKAIKQSDNVRHLAHRDVTELARIAAAQAARDQAGEIPERADISVIEPIHSDLEAALLNKLRPFKKAVGDEGSSPKLSDFLTDETSRSGSDDDAIDILKLHLTDEKDAK